MSITRIFPLFLFILALTFVVAAQKPVVLEPILPTEMSDAEAFVSAEGNFSIKIDRTKAIKSPSDVPAVELSYIWAFPALRYNLMVIKMPEDELPLAMTYEAFFKGQKEQFATIGGKFVSEGTAKAAGLDAAEMRMQMADGDLMYARVVVVGKKLYYMMAAFKPDDLYSDRVATRAFDSFKVLKAPAKATLPGEVTDAELFTSVEDKFSIRLHKTSVQRSKQNTENLYQWVYPALGLIVQMGASRMGAPVIPNDAAYEIFLAEEKKGAVENSGGQFVSQRKLTNGTHRGAETIVTGGGKKYFVRSFGVGNVMYYVLLSVPENNAEMEKTAQKVLDSFKIL